LNVALTQLKRGEVQMRFGRVRGGGWGEWLFYGLRARNFWTCRSRKVGSQWEGGVVEKAEKWVKTRDRTSEDRDKGVPVLLSEHHAMKAYWGSGCIAPHILDISTGSEWWASRSGRFIPSQLFMDFEKAYDL